jgi:hypothetical protein
LKVRLPDAALQAEIAKQAKLELCMHPEAPQNCTLGSIRAHTVQKATALRAIAERGHVLSGRDSRPGKRNEFRLESVGVNKASTFRGFCSHHDQSTFKEADTALRVSENICFLLGYRALAYELYMKIISVPVLTMYREYIDAGMSFSAQVEVQQHIHGQLYTSRLAVDEHSRLKGGWDRALITGDRSELSWASYRFEGVLPVVTSGAFYPEIDFSGQRLQALDAPIGHLGLLTFSVVPIDGGTHAIFAWLDRKPQNSQFVDSLTGISPLQMSSTLVQFCFDTSDNIFVRPSWWQALEPKYKKSLSDLLANSTPGDKNPRGLQLITDQLAPVRFLGVTRSDSPL